MHQADPKALPLKRFLEGRNPEEIFVKGYSPSAERGRSWFFSRYWEGSTELEAAVRDRPGARKSRPDRLTGAARRRRELGTQRVNTPGSRRCRDRSTYRLQVRLQVQVAPRGRRDRMSVAWIMATEDVGIRFAGQPRPCRRSPGLMRVQAYLASRRRDLNVVDVEHYLYLVPFVTGADSTRFLKTIIPSRKATRHYRKRRSS